MYKLSHRLLSKNSAPLCEVIVCIPLFIVVFREYWKSYHHETNNKRKRKKKRGVANNNILRSLV